MGPITQSAKDNLHRSNTANNFIWSAGLERCNKKYCYKAKIVRIQRLINVRIAKAYRTVSNEALCVMTGLMPINIKIEEVAKLCELTKAEGTSYDRAMEIRHWIPPFKTHHNN